MLTRSWRSQKNLSIIFLSKWLKSIRLKPNPATPTGSRSSQPVGRCRQSTWSGWSHDAKKNKMATISSSSLSIYLLSNPWRPVWIFFYFYANQGSSVFNCCRSQSKKNSAKMFLFFIFRLSNVQNNYDERVSASDLFFFLFSNIWWLLKTFSNNPKSINCCIIIITILK